MLRRWEVEWELRDLHPFRQHLLEQRRVQRRVRSRFRIALAVVLGATLAGTLAGMRLIDDGLPLQAGPQGAVWGGVHGSRSARGTMAAAGWRSSEPSTFWKPRYDPGTRSPIIELPRRGRRD
jgi:hypothetical protein